MSHTRGPWKVMPGSSSPRICVDGDRGWPIVVVISGHCDEAITANQHLIAAAPEMLEVLENLLKNEGYGTEGNEFWDWARDVIAKAKGGV